MIVCCLIDIFSQRCPKKFMFEYVLAAVIYDPILDFGIVFLRPNTTETKTNQIL